MLHLLTATCVLSLFNYPVGVAGGASNVVELTQSNFDTYVDGKRHAFVEFYAPWCGHCKSLAPVWEVLATAFKDEESVVVAKVDATKETELGSKYGVQGFPTLKYFRKGSTEPIDYESSRDIKGLMKWVNSNAGTFRDQSGKYMTQLGRVMSLEKPLFEFFSACKTNRDESCFSQHVEELKEKIKGVGSSQKKAADYYWKQVETWMKEGEPVMEKLNKEKERLTRLAKDQSVGADMKQWIYERSNILTSVSDMIQGSWKEATDIFQDEDESTEADDDDMEEDSDMSPEDMLKEEL